MCSGRCDVPTRGIVLEIDRPALVACQFYVMWEANAVHLHKLYHVCTIACVRADDVLGGGRGVAPEGPVRSLRLPSFRGRDLQTQETAVGVRGVPSQAQSPAAVWALPRWVRYGQWQGRTATRVPVVRATADDSGDACRLHIPSTLGPRAEGRGTQAPGARRHVRHMKERGRKGRRRQ